jgi:hypothetical protein
MVEVVVCGAGAGGNWMVGLGMLGVPGTVCGCGAA